MSLFCFEGTHKKGGKIVLSLKILDPQKMQLSHKTEDEQSQTFDAFHTAKQA